MGSHITVEPERFEAASSVLGHLVAVEGFHGLWALHDALDSCAGMAGDDPAGRAWAASYDAAAARTLQISGDVIAACYRLAALLQQTGFNYSGAELASTPGVTWSSTPDTAHWADASVSYPALSSAAGHNPTVHPRGFSLIEHVIDAVWPNGHQDRLHRAASAWTASASLFERIADNTAQADTCISLEHTPETPAALTAIHAMRSHLHEVAVAQRALAAACTEYAHHLDQVHSELVSELESLVEWTLAIEAAGGLLSVFTFGLAEAPTQAAEAARIAETARVITAIIERLQAFAAIAAAEVATRTEQLIVVGQQVRLLLDARVVTVEVTAVRASRFDRILRTHEQIAINAMAHASNFKLARVATTAASLEKKFKHAIDLGVMTKRSKAGFAAYKDALQTFIERPTTRRIVGTYHGEPAIVNYDPVTRSAVAQLANGDFITCWKLSDLQELHVAVKGELGGG